MVGHAWSTPDEDGLAADSRSLSFNGSISDPRRSARPTPSVETSLWLPGVLLGRSTVVIARLHRVPSDHYITSPTG